MGWVIVDELKDSVTKRNIKRDAKKNGRGREKKFTDLRENSV